MVRNYTSNDIDFVQPTQYPTSKNRVAKRPPPEPEPLPTFEPLPILNESQYGQPKLLAYINNQDPAQLFRLFWTDELMDQLVEYMNKNAKLHPIIKKKDFPR